MTTKTATTKRPQRVAAALRIIPAEVRDALRMFEDTAVCRGADEATHGQYTRTHAVLARSIAALASAELFVLVWGGGDNPEDPGISLHRTFEGAIAQALKYADAEGYDEDDSLSEDAAYADASGAVVEDASNRAYIERKLREGGTAWGLPNETSFSIQTATIQDEAPTRPTIERQTVKLIQTRIEVGAPRNGKPGYRWTTGYYVVNPETERREHPPIRRKEAYARARELGGKGCRIELRQDAEEARS